MLLSVDSGREVKYDGEQGEDVSAGAIAYFDQLCTREGNGKRDPRVVVNWWAFPELVCLVRSIDWNNVQDDTRALRAVGCAKGDVQ